MSSETVVEICAEAGARTCILLCGVHAGGNHALAAVLTRLGVAVLPSAGDASALAALNAEILASAGTDAWGVEPLSAAWYASPLRTGFRARAIAELQAIASTAGLFALNDPAVSRLIPFWTDVVAACGAKPLVISFVDAPGALLGTLGESPFGPAARSVLWLARLIETERAGRSTKRAWVTIDSLLRNPDEVVARMQHDLDLAWPSLSVRTWSAISAEIAKLQRVVPGAAVPVSATHAALIDEIEAVMARWAATGEDASGRAQFDRVSAQFGEALAVADVVFGVIGGVMESLHDLREQVQILRSGLVEGNGRPNQLAAAEPIAADMATAIADVERRWVSIFEAGRNESEILVEQNAVFQRTIADLSDELAKVRLNFAEAEKDISRLNLKCVAQEAEADKSNKLILTLRKALDAAEEALAKLRSDAKAREATIESLVLSLQKRSDSPPAPSSKFGGPSAKPFLPNLLSRLTPKSRRKAQRHQQVRAMVEQSGLFDAKFYAARYPDVVSAGGDLLDHFIQFGGAEGRHPSGAFNSKWYISENSDVREKALNPLVHYLEHGRDEGRRRHTLTDAGTSRRRSEVSTAPPSATSAQPSVPQPQVTAQPGEFAPTWTPRTAGWRALLLAYEEGRRALVGFEDFAKVDKASAITLAGITIGLVGESLPQEVVDRLMLFTALRGREAPDLAIAGQPAQGLPAHALLGTTGFGIEELADGWFSGQNTLNLRFKGDFAGVVRAFQHGDGTFARVADVQIDGGDALLRAELINPFEELLLVVSALDGIVHQCVVVPFPSLMRGGLHHGEYAVIECAPGGMTALADYVRALAADQIGWPEGPAAYAVSRIEVDMHGANGTEPIFRPDVIAMLKVRHGLSVSALDDDAARARPALVATFAEGRLAEVTGRTGDGATLVLPCDCLPSIHAVVARRLSCTGGANRLVVVDGATLKMRADVTLPMLPLALQSLHNGDLPAARPEMRRNGEVEASTERCLPLLPLAVRHYNRLAWNVDPLMPVSPDQVLAFEQPAGAGEGPQLSVIIDMAQVDVPVSSCLAALEHQIFAGSIEVILAGWEEGQALPVANLPIRTFDGRDKVRAARLNGAAALSSAPGLMVLDAQVLLSDPRILPILVQVVQLAGVATAACAIVMELEDEDSASLHATGYFPTRISLGGEPVFNLAQADIGGLLPAAIYPVIANQLKCCVIERSAWDALGGFDAARFPLSGFDLDFGYRAVAAGYANYCTTLVRAGCSDIERTDDFPDPLAHRAVHPADWQAVFDRVTVVREMRW